MGSAHLLFCSLHIPVKYVGILLVADAFFQRDVERVMSAFSHSHILQFASSRKKAHLSIVDGKRVDFVGERKGVFDAIALKRKQDNILKEIPKWKNPR